MMIFCNESTHRSDSSHNAQLVRGSGRNPGTSFLFCGISSVVFWSHLHLHYKRNSSLGYGIVLV